MSNLRLRPTLDAEGKPRLVRDPATGVPLSSDGEWKAAAPFWSRRLRDGEVEVVRCDGCNDEACANGCSKTAAPASVEDPPRAPRPRKSRRRPQPAE